MTKFIDRNWAKWEANLAPVLAATEEEAASKNRRRTIKMNDDDPDEESKNRGGAGGAPAESFAESMFSHLPPNEPPKYATAA